MGKYIDNIRKETNGIQVIHDYFNIRKDARESSLNNKEENNNGETKNLGLVSVNNFVGENAFDKYDSRHTIMKRTNYSTNTRRDVMNKTILRAIRNEYKTYFKQF
jgi:hypothetical protein